MDIHGEMNEYRLVGITDNPDPETNRSRETVIRTFTDPQLAVHAKEHAEMDGDPMGRQSYDRYVIQRRDVENWVQH